jgi:uncharacterized glyoxalase superfamily protein PhnB
LEFIGICLITKDVTALASFYSKILGVEAEGSDVHMELKTEGVGIAIFSAECMKSMAQGSIRNVGHGSIVIMIKVKDADFEYERLKKLNVDFVKLPETHPWGSRSFWFRDSDGNIVDFVCVPNK